MFELNREFIINNNNGPLTSGKRFEFDATAKVLKVGKMINIEAAKVRSIHRAPYHPEVSEVVTLPVTGLDGTLVITIGQEGRVISLVSDRLAHHTKDYIFNGTPAQWQSQFERQAAMEDMDRLIDVKVASNTLTIEAKDCYTRIEKVVYEGATKQVWERADEFKAAALKTGTWPTGATLKVGTEGMGTVTRILKNMRLQTNAHLSAHGFDMDERPLPGGEYEQWTIQYVSERRHQSGEVFGSINHSLVTLIFFVNVADSALKTDWENAMYVAYDKGVSGAVAGTMTAPGDLSFAAAADLKVCEVAKDLDSNKIPGHQTNAAANPTEIEAKEPVATEAKKHKA